MRFAMMCILLCTLLPCLTVETKATIRNVPSSYATIQGAINASANGDTVLVAPGRYKENINFRGKRIIVASQFLVSPEPATIDATIIDGSAPASADTASCVIIASGEDSTAVLEGFTLTGGTGTKWEDKHNHNFYREGGGILTENSSPTIRNNRIVGNSASNKAGVTSAGGGAIRSDGGVPRILGNLIAFNTGLYGAGITLNYTGAIIRNNIIFGNTGGQDYGGSGIWAYATYTAPIIVENNTIAENVSAQDGGGILVWSTSMTVRNCIVWANSAATSPQISLRDAGTAAVTYSDIEGGWAGAGVINQYPAFADSSLLLLDTSPCVDSGNPDPLSDDPPNDLIPTLAQWPSKGLVRNDMGAFGGPGRRFLQCVAPAAFGQLTPRFDFGYTLPGVEARAWVAVRNDGTLSLRLDSVRAQFNNATISVVTSLPATMAPLTTDTIFLAWNPAASVILVDTIAVHHNGALPGSPVRIPASGSSVPTPILRIDLSQADLGSVPQATSQRDTTVMVYNVGTGTDSVAVSIDPKTVSPAGALAAAPPTFAIAPGDSIPVTFTVYPPMVTKVGLGIYGPILRFDSRFGVGTTRFEKTIRFKIINWLGVGSDHAAPMMFALEQNYPNPFNPVSTIGFSIAESRFVSLRVYDILGREVAVLLNEKKPAGNFEVSFDASTLSSGTYFYRLSAGSFVETKRMVLVR